ETRFPSARKLRAAGPYHWGRIACRIPQAKATCDTRWKTSSAVLLEAFAAELPSAECAATSAPFAAAVANREQLPDQIPLAREDVHFPRGSQIHPLVRPCFADAFEVAGHREWQERTTAEPLWEVRASCCLQAKKGGQFGDDPEVESRVNQSLWIR